MTTVEPRTVTFGPVEIRWDPRVLEPRPWTLLQSRWAADLAADLPAGPVLELCAGAGQIGLAAAVLTGRRLVQVDADPAAAAYAAENAARAGRAGTVEVRCARLQEALGGGERFPLVLADPPYLPSREVDRWPADPLTAIDGGDDGLDVVRACLLVAGRHVRRDGAVLLQVAGAGQAEQVRALLAADPDARLAVEEVREVDDDRAVVLLRPGSGD